jgi:hypothetical protein
MNRCKVENPQQYLTAMSKTRLPNIVTRKHKWNLSTLYNSTRHPFNCIQTHSTTPTHLQSHVTTCTKTNRYIIIYMPLPKSINKRRILRSMV